MRFEMDLKVKICGSLMRFHRLLNVRNSFEVRFEVDLKVKITEALARLLRLRSNEVL